MDVTKEIVFLRISSMKWTDRFELKYSLCTLIGIRRPGVESVKRKIMINLTEWKYSIIQ